MDSPTQQINPIDLEIYWNRLISVVDEAGAAMKRTSFSTVVRESNDYTCVMLDADGALLTQSSWSVPGLYRHHASFATLFPCGLSEGDARGRRHHPVEQSVDRLGPSQRPDDGGADLPTGTRRCLRGHRGAPFRYRGTAVVRKLDGVVRGRTAHSHPQTLRGRRSQRDNHQDLRGQRPSAQPRWWATSRPRS